MSGAPSPPVLLEPIASSAPSGVDPGDKTNPLPNSPTGTNAASVQGGFPAITMESELAGGLPPLGQDMNGFLFLMSSHTMYSQCGQPYLYNATLAGAMGGYKVGTILGMADGSGTWLCVSDGNTSNPDAGGAGWVPFSTYGVTTVSSTGGTLILTLAQTRYSVIIVSGTLTSNLSVQMPGNIGAWLIVNITTGGFTITVQTIAALAGVVVPAGGFGAPVGVYCMGNGNIYPTVSPLSVPIDQAPTPLTLVERTNAGYALATYFNQNSALETPAVGAVFVQNAAADGFLRKIPLADFVLQLENPTATVNANGYALTFAGGYVLQFGPVSAPSWASAPVDVSISFPTPFPTQCIAAFSTSNRSIASRGQSLDGSGFASSATRFGMVVTIDAPSGWFFAIGN